MPSHQFRTAAVVTAATLLVAACSTQSPTAPSVGASAGMAGLAATSAAASPASAPAPSPATTNYEVKFMQDMIDHHHMAVMTAEMCVEKAVHAELQTLCSNIIATQNAEIATMQSWLESWYGISYAPEMHGMGQMEHFSRLTGATFEIAFMEMMIRHHEGAVREGEHCIDRAYHPELITLCQNIVTTQTAEIAQMESWLCQWYGRCH